MLPCLCLIPFCLVSRQHRGVSSTSYNAAYLLVITKQQFLSLSLSLSVSLPENSDKYNY